MIPNASDEIGEAVREHHALATLRLLNGEDLRRAANDHLLPGALPVHGRTHAN
jgi:hypothetical protein